MNKLYNSQIDITSNFETFLINAVPGIRKTQTNIIPSIMFGMITSESCSSSDIAKRLKDDAFSFNTLKSCIQEASDLFKDRGFELIFLICDGFPLLNY